MCITTNGGIKNTAFETKMFISGLSLCIFGLSMLTRIAIRKLWMTLVYIQTNSMPIFQKKIHVRYYSKYEKLWLVIIAICVTLSLYPLHFPKQKKILEETKWRSFFHEHNHVEYNYNLRTPNPLIKGHELNVYEAS